MIWNNCQSIKKLLGSTFGLGLRCHHAPDADYLKPGDPPTITPQHSSPRSPRATGGAGSGPQCVPGDTKGLVPKAPPWLFLWTPRFQGKPMSVDTVAGTCSSFSHLSWLCLTVPSLSARRLTAPLALISSAENIFRCNISEKDIFLGNFYKQLALQKVNHRIKMIVPKQLLSQCTSRTSIIHTMSCPLLT